MSLDDVSHAHSPALLPCAIPARPYRGTSFSSFTTMLRSASLAALEMLRVCCCCSGARASRLWRATLRMHELHWGSSVDRLSEAMAGCGGRLVLPKKDAGRCPNFNLEILATDKRGDWPALGIHFAGAASPGRRLMTDSETVQLSDSNGGERRTTCTLLFACTRPQSYLLEPATALRCSAPPPSTNPRPR